MLKTSHDLLSPGHKVVTQHCKHIAMAGLGNGPWKQRTSDDLRGVSVESLLTTGSDTVGARVESLLVSRSSWTDIGLVLSARLSTTSVTCKSQ
jgi:hypothetical protein